MKRNSQILIGAVCVTLLLVSWVIAISSKSDAEKQLELLQKAAELVGDGIYILALPLLEEAAGYNAAHTLAAETELKKVYLALIDNRGFSRKYTGLLEKQMIVGTQVRKCFLKRRAIILAYQEYRKR